MVYRTSPKINSHCLVFVRVLNNGRDYGLIIRVYINNMELSNKQVLVSELFFVH